MRRKREETGVSRLEVWDGTQLLQEKDLTTKAEVARYLLQNDSYSGLRAQRLASDNIWRYFGYDLQGSTRLLLNSDGSSNLSLLYRAFGQKQASSGAGRTLMQFGAFWGYEWDADTRMWVKARHLSGTQGRWLSPDPIGFDGGDWNLFRYVGNNPMVEVDSTGLRPFDPITGEPLPWPKPKPKPGGLPTLPNVPVYPNFSHQFRDCMNDCFNTIECKTAAFFGGFDIGTKAYEVDQAQREASIAWRVYTANPTEANLVHAKDLTAVVQNLSRGLFITILALGDGILVGCVLHCYGVSVPWSK